MATLSQVYYSGDADKVISAARKVWLNSAHANRGVYPEGLDNQECEPLGTQE